MLKGRKILKVCRFSVKYVPFYYFIYLIQCTDEHFDKNKLKAELNKIVEDCKMSKTYLIQRLKSDDNSIKNDIKH